MNEYTVEELLDMDDDGFRDAVVDDLNVTFDWDGPFQDGRVVRRTLSALKSWQSAAFDDIVDREEDPACPAELLEKTRRFYGHISAVVKNTEKHVASRQQNNPSARQWKQLLFLVVDAIKQGWDDDDILSLALPAFSNGGSITVDEWHEIRLEKHPDRKRAERAA